MDSDSSACNNYYSHDLYSEPVHALMGHRCAMVARRALLKVYTSVFFMVDESWALAISYFAAGGRDGAFLLGSGLIMFVAWVSSTPGWTDGGSFNTEPGTVGTGFRIYGGLYSFAGWYVEREIEFLTVGGGSDRGSSGGALAAV